jgi:aldose 1-epimerase
MENQKTTGRPVTLESDRFRAVVDAEGGAVIRRWDMVGKDGRSVELFKPIPETSRNPLEGGCFPLVPWSNRIGHARFRYNGKDYALRPNFAPEAHAIHGEGWRAPWSIRRQTDDTLQLVFEHTDTGAARGGWPWPYRAVQEIALTSEGMTVRLALTNQGTTPMPGGLGLHPFFPKMPAARLTARLERMWVNGPDMLPTGTVEANDPAGGLDLHAQALDNCFAGWDGRADLDLHTGRLRVTIDADEVFGHLVIFVPPGDDYFCVEPVSHANDAVNLAERDTACTGLRRVEPGETFSGSIRFKAAVVG